MPLINPLDIFHLLLINALSYFLVIEIKTSLFYLSVKIWVKFFKLKPVFVSDEVSLSFLTRLVNDLRPPLVTAFEATNQAVSLEAHTVFDNTVDVIPNVDASSHNEVHRVNIVKLVVDYHSFVIFDRFQLLQKVNHEITVSHVVPVEESILMFRLKVFELKKTSELLDEISKQKVFINSYLYFLWQLLENCDVGLGLNCDVPVVIPFVVEILFHGPLEVLFNRVALVKVVEEAEEFRQVITIIKSSILLLK